MSLWDYAENSKAEDSFIKRMSYDDTDHRSTCFIRFDPSLALVWRKVKLLWALSYATHNYRSNCSNCSEA